MVGLRILGLLALLVGFLAQAGAQERRDWEAYLEELANFEGLDAAQWEENFELFSSLEAEPMNINRASREDLERLPFLSEAQVEAISEYIYRHGPIRSLGELMAIRQIDYYRRQLLECFVYAGPDLSNRLPSLKETLRRGRHELWASLRVPMYTREGDRNGYLGYKYKHWLRYTFALGDRVTYGFLGSQDAGEPFFSGKNSLGYDHYSYYIMMRRLGPVSAVVAGHYRLSFAMGLVMNTSFSLGKLSALQTMGRYVAAVSPSLSRMSGDYLQGVATTIDVSDRLKATAFFSLRPIDATLNADDGSIATVVTSGYHRTASELERKNNATMLTSGANITYTTSRLRLGASTVFAQYSRPLSPNTATVYRRHYAQGSRFANFGVEYSLRGRVVSVGGETAFDRQGHLATINRVGVSITPELSALVLQRYYSYKYTAPHANSFAEGGRTQNESGVYVGLTWSPRREVQLTVYTDYARFAWPRYLISQPSAASDHSLSAKWSPGNWTLNASFRLHIRQRDNDDKTSLISRKEHRARLAAGYTWASGWWSKTQADLSLTDFRSVDRGLLLAQSVGVKKKRLSAAAGVSYFHTDSYESRLYSYERGLRYSFSYPMFYGHGLRLYATASVDIGERLALSAKFGLTNYFDRATIGSGLQAINGSSAADLDVQARVRF